MNAKHVLILGAIFPSMLFAGELENIIQQAENAIFEQYKTPLANKSASRKLVLILQDEKLSESQKISMIKKEFLSLEKEEITPENAYKLIFVPQLIWKIHSIAIAYNIQNTKNILFSAQEMNKENATREKSQEANYGESQKTALQVGFSGGASGDLTLSFNPLKLLSSKAAFSAEANGSIKIDDTHSEVSLWSKKNQLTLSKRYEEMVRILSDTKISDCYLTFAITFKNNTKKDLFFSSNSTIPVYANDELILNAVPENLNMGDYKIPANSLSVISFRGKIDNTKALELVHFMTSGSPKICPEKGQLFVRSEDHLIKNAIQNSLAQKTISITAKNLEWRIRSTWNSEPVTLRQALLAINSIYLKAPFQFNEKGELINVFGENCRIDGAKLGDTLVPVWHIANNYRLGELSSKILDVPLRTDAEIKMLDLKIFFADPNKDALLRKVVEKPLKNLWKNKNITAGVFLVLGELTAPKNDISKTVKMLEEIADTKKTKENIPFILFAKLALACIYFDENSVENKQKSYAIFRQVSKNERTPKTQDIIAMAQVFLADFYINGYGIITPNKSKALSILEPLVKEKNQAATVGLLDLLFSSDIEADQFKGVAMAESIVDNAEQKSLIYKLSCTYLIEYFLGKKESSKAVEYLAKCKGFPPAELMFGEYYRYLGDYKTAFPHFLRSAQLINYGIWNSSGFYEQSLIELARCYLEGRGVVSDLAQAKKYAKEAVENGNVKGEVMLGRIALENGEVSEAFHVFEKAAKQDNATAQAWLGVFYLEGENTSKAVEAFEHAIKSDEDGFAQYFYGMAKLKGDIVKKDLKTGYELIKEAADRDNLYAQYLYAILLLVGGESFPKDPEQGISYLEKLESIMPEAKAVYAKCLLFGIGTPKNEERALGMLQSMDEDIPGVLSAYARYYYLRGEYGKAFSFAKKSASISDPDGQFVLGICYYEGGGCSKDYALAKKWLTIASEAGHPEAKLILEKITKH